MIPIYGNTTATVEIKRSGLKNLIGENTEEWVGSGTVLGWLDYANGENDVVKLNAKVQDTTHYFLCDYSRWVKGATAENSRLVIDGDIYNVLLVDDPMGMHQHLEIYLQYIGGGLGVS